MSGMKRYLFTTVNNKGQSQYDIDKINIDKGLIPSTTIINKDSVKNIIERKEYPKKTTFKVSKIRAQIERNKTKKYVEKDFVLCVNGKQSLKIGINEKGKISLIRYLSNGQEYVVGISKYEQQDNNIYKLTFSHFNKKGKNSLNLLTLNHGKYIPPIQFLGEVIKKASSQIVN